MENLEEYYDWKHIFVITIELIIGVMILYFTWHEMEPNYKNLNNYFCQNGTALMFSLFFIAVGLSGWIKVLINLTVKPKKESLYLENEEYYTYSFIDAKGKKYKYSTIDTRQFHVGKYYTVIKTRDFIKAILSISSNTFLIHNKKPSYWLNWYSPMVNFENLLILPVVYIVFLSGFLKFVMTEGFAKLFGLGFMVLAGILIIYDMIYKIRGEKPISKIEINSDLKLVNDQSKKIDNSQNIEFLSYIFGGLLFTGICGLIFINGANFATRIAIIPFLICSLSILSIGIIKFVKVLSKRKKTKSEHNSLKEINEKNKCCNLESWFSKLYVVGFLLFWFGFLIVWCYLSIKLKYYSMLLFSIPFWVVGIIVTYKNFKK